MHVLYTRNNTQRIRCINRTRETNCTWCFNSNGCDYEFGPIQNGVNEFIKTPRLDALFEKYAIEIGEAVSHDDFGYGSTDTGNVSHVVPTIHPHIKIGSRNLVGHTHRFREAAASVHGDQAVVRGAKIIALMGLELIENQPLFEAIVEQHSHIKGITNNGENKQNQPLTLSDLYADNVVYSSRPSYVSNPWLET